MLQKRETKQEDSENTSDWKKKIDLSKSFKERGNLDGSVQYVNKKEEEIYIDRHGSDDNILISFKTKNTELLKKILKKCRESGLHIPGPELLVLDLGRINIWATCDKSPIAIFIEIVDEFVSLGQHVKNEILAALDLKQIARVLMQMDTIANIADKEIIAEHKGTSSKQEDIKKKLTLLFKEAKTSENQKLIDIAYNQLSGGKGLNPVVTNVRLNTETLLALAERLDSQEQEIARLQAELAKGNKKTAITPTLFSDSPDNTRSRRSASLA